MKVYDGSILTCDAQDRVFKYLVEDGSRIAYVGDELPARYARIPSGRFSRDLSANEQHGFESNLAHHVKRAAPSRKPSFSYAIDSILQHQ